MGGGHVLSAGGDPRAGRSPPLLRVAIVERNGSNELTLGKMNPLLALIPPKFGEMTFAIASRRIWGGYESKSSGGDPRGGRSSPLCDTLARTGLSLSLSLTLSICLSPSLFLSLSLSLSLLLSPSLPLSRTPSLGSAHARRQVIYESKSHGIGSSGKPKG